jgi:hypothetical protein
MRHDREELVLHRRGMLGAGAFAVLQVQRLVALADLAQALGLVARDLGIAVFGAPGQRIGDAAGVERLPSLRRCQRSSSDRPSRGRGAFPPRARRSPVFGREQGLERPAQHLVFGIAEHALGAGLFQLVMQPLRPW